MAVPWQRVLAGTQRPVHWPLTHANGQAGVASQTPASLQDCGTFASHCRLPGVQAPAQAPAAQTYSHVAPSACHWPAASQSRGCLPAQSRVPGTQTPVH